MDIEAFLQAEELPPPHHVSERILDRVYRDLRPSLTRVSGKTLLIHASSATFSLAFICPQFGVSPLGNHGLAHLLMHLGHAACAAACGAVFLGLSTFLSALILSQAELTVIRRHRAATFFALSLLSLTMFGLVGSSIMASATIFWMAGSILGGASFLELGLLARASLRSQ